MTTATMALTRKRRRCRFFIVILAFIGLKLVYATYLLQRDGGKKAPFLVYHTDFQIRIKQEGVEDGVEKAMIR
jgi:hypothetical protein